MFLSRIHPYTRIALTAVGVLLLTSCAGAPGGNGMTDQSAATRVWSTASLRSGFACCNLRYSGDQINSSNYVNLPFIAAGTPVLIRRSTMPRRLSRSMANRCCCGPIQPRPVKTLVNGLTGLSWPRIRGAALKAFQSECVRQSSWVA